MGYKIFLRIGSIGIFLMSIFFMDFKNLSISSNWNIYIMWFAAFLLWLISYFINPFKNIKKSIAILNYLIAFLTIFVSANIFLIIKDPTNLRHYGWIGVSICFIVSYSMIKKANKDKLNAQQK